MLSTAKVSIRSRSRVLMSVQYTDCEHTVLTVRINLYESDVLSMESTYH